MLKNKTKYEKLVNERFGQLKIIEINAKERKRGGSNRNIYYANCECSCGKFKEIEVSAIIAKRTTSCGCRRDQYDKIRGKNNVLYKGYKDISAKYFGGLKRGADSRNLKFLISKEDIWNVYVKQNKRCALTGWPISWDKKANLKCSVDRIDSSKDYTIDNIQIIEVNLNIMKMKLSQEKFIQICKDVVEFQRTKNAN